MHDSTTLASTVGVANQAGGLSGEHFGRSRLLETLAQHLPMRTAHPGQPRLQVRTSLWTMHRMDRRAGAVPGAQPGSSLWTCQANTACHSIFPKRTGMFSSRLSYYSVRTLLGVLARRRSACPGRMGPAVARLSKPFSRWRERAEGRQSETHSALTSEALGAPNLSCCFAGDVPREALGNSGAWPCCSSRNFVRRIS